MSWYAMLTICLPLADGAEDCVRLPFRPHHGGMVWESKEACEELLPAIVVIMDRTLAVEGWPEAEIRHARCEPPFSAS